ncbi:hypothetical protein [Wolbachia endosymbiont of Protocalliphora sialia]
MRWNDMVECPSCHSSTPFLVIPVLRHWDPVKFTSIKVINVSDDGKMDPSVGALG